MKQVGLVTGATSGIGAAIAARFLKEGHYVIATGRRLQRLEAWKKTLPISQQDNLYIASFDITDSQACREFFSKIPAQFQAIDVLVNNAGLALGLEPAHQASLLEWDQMIDTNIQGLISMTNLVLPGMLDRNKGHIFNVGSVAGTYPYIGGNVYGSTKAFVHEYTADLRFALSTTSIRLTSIEPGMVGGTEFSNVRLGDDAKARKVYEGVEAMTADDIAEAIYWSATLPPRVNINRLELMPVQQTFSALKIHRESIE
jgi:3-hydroxy acid dehydrogenase/malonic semialdehyde reductase